MGIGRWFVLPLGAALSLATTALPGAEQPADSAPPADSPPPAHARELPPLPHEPAAMKEATLAELADIDELLSRITAEEANRRDDGVRAILELTPRMVPAIRKRLDDLADSADKNALKQLLLETRRSVKDEPRDEVPGGPEDKSSSGPDYLSMMEQHARPSSPAWRDLVKLLALSRMLEHVGTTPAVRGLVDIYVHFGEFVRIDTQHALARLGDRAVPALIEARRHPAQKIAHWAERELDMLGRAAPSQAVRIANPEILADVLRAYGRTRDLDAARVVVSFAGSERAMLRMASRQAIAMLGEAGHWQLRDAYEDVMGKRAARDWTWERTARELFGELDRLRRAEVYDRFDAGQKAEVAGDFETMRKAYDDVLVRAPFFERADEMVGGYWEYGKRNAKSHPEQAIVALRRAERLSEGKPAHDKIASLLDTLEAERLAAAHIVDRSLLHRALALDASNSRAQAELNALSVPVKTGDRKLRYYAAASILFAGLLGSAFVLLKPRPKRDEPGYADEPSGAPPNPPPVA